MHTKVFQEDFIIDLMQGLSDSKIVQLLKQFYARDYFVM